MQESRSLAEVIHQEDPANPIHAVYGDNALKWRLRAHPDVAEIWHSDLVAARAAAAPAS